MVAFKQYSKKHVYKSRMYKAIAINPTITVSMIEEILSSDVAAEVTGPEGCFNSWLLPRKLTA